MENNKIAIAMSGGIDSSTAAFLLKKKGYHIIGITLKLFSKNVDPEINNKILYAKKVCGFLNIEHKILEIEKIFKQKVIEYFKNQYIIGRTPNPCAVCNKEIKFGILLNEIFKLGYQKIATGHYCNIVYKNSIPFLKKASDKNKSQEYFLSLLDKDKLEHIVFPLSFITKDEVRIIAKENKLPINIKNESQDICFIRGIKYLDFLKNNFKIDEKVGNILSVNNEIIGKHNGIINYTIGQRKGLKISDSTPYFVLKIDPQKNNIIVGKREKLYIKKVFVKPIIWKTTEKLSCFVKIRYRHIPAIAEIEKIKNKIEINFKEAQFAPSPGQIAAFYNEDNEVIGSGIIESFTLS